MILNIRDFGAVPDGTLQTAAIQAAIDQCKNGGGTVVIPAGTYVSGRLNLVSNLTLKLEEGAVLAGSLDWRDYSLVPDDDGVWKGFKHRTSFLRADSLENVTVEGPGVIDGCDCSNPGGEEGFRGPHACYFLHCYNVFLKDYTIRNSANWAHCLEKSSGIRLENVTVEAGHDGCHMRGCTDVVIDHCSFYTGDDCVAGVDNVNVSVLNSTLNGSCSAFRYGGKGLRVEKCRLYGPGRFFHRFSKRTEMISAFTFFSFTREKPVVSEDWIIRDCTMERVGRLLSYNVCDHCWQVGSVLKDISFEDCVITAMSDASWGFCDKEPSLALTLRRCRAEFAEGMNLPFLRLKNFHSCRLEDVSVNGLNGAHLVESDGTGEVELKGVCCDGIADVSLLQNDAAPSF